MVKVSGVSALDSLVGYEEESGNPSGSNGVEIDSFYSLAVVRSVPRRFNSIISNSA